jgi:tryptophan synthase alpha chain
MSAIDQVFAELRSTGKRALLPFITAGDPDLDFTRQLISMLNDSGCSIAEVGIPYSDPIADGPVIQASYTRALNHKVKLNEILAVIQRDSASRTMPLVTMVSYAIIYRHGLEAFVERAQAAGLAGAIVPDLLVEESAPLRAICHKRDFSLIQLVTPTTPPERALRIAEESTGFLYFVSVTGITGERQELPQGLVDRVGWLRERTRLPICIGFGISKPSHIKLLAPVADGFIVGSAIVRLVEQAAQDRNGALKAISQLIRDLQGALP